MNLSQTSKSYWFPIAFFLLLAQIVAAQVNEDKNQITSNAISLDSIPHITTQQYQNCDVNYTYQFSKPKFWDMFKYAPKDIYKLGVFSAQRKNIKWDVLALGSTMALIPVDQQLLDNADVLGNKLGGWNKDSQYGKVLGIFTIVPKNVPSAVYYMGNGGTTLLLSGLFYGIGKFSHNDLRALNTSNELVECIVSVGLTTQTLKHITGRQSPSRAIPDGNSGGDWDPAPSFGAFQRNEPNYDAMPSGHIATFMSTVTIIATNYPEIKWIKPVGYSLMSVLAFNMVSGKVHWTSDYPIGIFIGYVMGKEIANRRITKIPKNKVGLIPIKPKQYKLDYNINNFQNSTLVGATITF